MSYLNNSNGFSSTTEVYISANTFLCSPRNTPTHTDPHPTTHTLIHTQTHTHSHTPTRPSWICTHTLSRGLPLTDFHTHTHCSGLHLEVKCANCIRPWGGVRLAKFHKFQTHSMDTIAEPLFSEFDQYYYCSFP